jgi:Na+-driven multidrug efflux pump
VGAKALQMICLGYVFFAYGMVISQSLNGAGDTKTPSIINVFCFWLIQIPLAYLLAVTFNMGPTGVFITVGFCFSLHALVCIYVFRLGKWKTISI